jgi:hypothetical protein
LECLECGSDYFLKYFLFLKIIFDINPPLGGNYISKRLVRLFHHESLANDTCFREDPYCMLAIGWQMHMLQNDKKIFLNFLEILFET